MLRLVYKLFRKEFNKLIAESQSRPKGFKSMIPIFIDSEGRQYYKFANFSELPLERLGKLNTFLMWMSTGLGVFTVNNKKQVLELDLILAEMESALQEGLKKTNVAARIGAMIEEIKDRKNMVIHSELLYNLLAVQWVREDESPDLYDSQIQLDKVNTFKKEVSKSNSYFFFAKAKLSELLPYLEMSEEKWNEYWQKSEARMRALKEVLSSQLQGQELENLKVKENHI